MERSIWLILFSAFVIGALLIFGAEYKYSPLDIRLHTFDGKLGTSDTSSYVYQCNTYSIYPDTSFSAVTQNVKWRIGNDNWIIDDAIVEEYHFTELGKIPIEVYVDGKLRGARFIVVEPCAGARISIPEKIRQGDSQRFKDETKGSLARRWFVKNSVSSDYKLYEDQGGILDFEFDYSGPYSVKVEVDTKDTTFVWVRDFEVGKKREERPMVASVPKKESRPTSEVNTNKSEKPVVKPIDEPVIEEPVETIEESAEVIEEEESSEGFSDYFGKSIMVDNSWKVEESTWFFGADECLSYNGDQRTLFLRNLKADICLTNLYFVPNLDITGNKVKISIENTKDVDRKFVKRPIVRTLSRTNSGMLSNVNVKSIGCYLKKGESYKIVVDPEEGYQVGEVDKSDYSCISGMEEFKYAEVQVQSKTKILKIEYKLRE